MSAVVMILNGEFGRMKIIRSAVLAKIGLFFVMTAKTIRHGKTSKTKPKARNCAGLFLCANIRAHLNGEKRWKRKKT